MRKIRIAIAVILGLLAILMAATMPIVTAYAQATATHTPYPFATTTPGPTITPVPTCPTGPIAPNWLDMSCPQATTIYSSSNCTLDQDGNVISCSGNDPFSTMDIVPPDLLGWLTKVKETLQKLADIATKIREWYDLILTSTDTRTNTFALRIRTLSPFPFVRGAMILFADFEWIGIIGVWLIIAAIDIAVITAIRFVVSMWGIIQRIIQLIKLIPFL